MGYTGYKDWKQMPLQHIDDYGDSNDEFKKERAFMELTGESCKFCLKALHAGRPAECFMYIENTEKAEFFCTWDCGEEWKRLYYV